jgi:serine phosphatase RsbU (regulator of sigma subunit)
VERKWGRGVFLAAALAPILIAAVFPHPAQRVVVPASLMLLVVMAVTILGSTADGVVAAFVSAMSIWFFNLPPAFSFRTESASDVAAIVLVFVTGTAGAVIIGVFDRRLQVSRLAEAKLAAAVDAHQALLPDISAMTVREVEAAAAYVTGSADGAIVGGDWYAIVPLTSTTLGVAIGDVVGHGYNALAAMAEVRFALRTLATPGRRSADVLADVEANLARFPVDALYGSALYGVLDAERGSFTFANAGHLPPLVCRAGGTVEIVDHVGSPWLFTDMPATRRPERAVQLERGDAIVLFTDGLVERRGESLDVGLERLAAALRHDGLDAFEQLPDRLLVDLVGRSPADDVAILTLRLAGDPALRRADLRVVERDADHEPPIRAVRADDRNDQPGGRTRRRASPAARSA